MKKIQYQPISNEAYANAPSYKIQEQVVSQGVAYFTAEGKKHFPDQQRGELETYQGMQHLFDPPKRLLNDYDRSLNTKDIDGAVTNTLRSKVVKNLELAQAYKQEKQKSLWESSKGPSEPEYQARKRWDDFDPYKNRSAIYTQNADQKQQLPENDNLIRGQSLNNTDKKQLSQDDRDKLYEYSQQRQQYEQYQQPEQNRVPEQQSEQRYQQNNQSPQSYPQQKHQWQLIQPQQQLIQPQYSQPISQQTLQQQQQYYQSLQQSQSQPHLRTPPQQQQNPTLNQPQYQQQIPRYTENDRQAQQQLLMQKQWEQQKQEGMYKLQQSQNEKILEQKQSKQQQNIDQQLIDQQKRLEANQKQQYARELRQQQESNRDGSRKGFTPPPVSKSEIINQLLQPPKMQKSQGFDEQNQVQALRDSLTKEVEDVDKKMVINRFRPHELQQYIYDMKNGRIGGSRTRNNPTFMSYAGQQLVNQ